MITDVCNNNNTNCMLCYAMLYILWYIYMFWLIDQPNIIYNSQKQTLMWSLWSKEDDSWY